MDRRIRTIEPPRDSLLERAAPQGGYVDAYAARTAAAVSLPTFVRAFYTTPLFRLERWILALARLPSTDAHAAEIASGARSTFAAWRLQARREHEILLRDLTGRTASWLRVDRIENDGTLLQFGSLIEPVIEADGRVRVGPAYRALLGFHRAYSRALLSAARRRLDARTARARPD